MRQLLTIILFVSIYSCIPTRITPNIETDKVVIAKKFTRDLPRSYSFIFEDPKKANEFYSFINTKYNLNHGDVEYNVPIHVNDSIYYLSFHERERTTKTLNLIPFLIDAKLESEGYGPLLEDIYTSRMGNWYLILTVYDDNFKDCLKPDYPHREAVLAHLRNLQNEYLTTHNYLESQLSHMN